MFDFDSFAKEWSHYPKSILYCGHPDVVKDSVNIFHPRSLNHKQLDEIYDGFKRGEQVHFDLQDNDEFVRRQVYACTNCVKRYRDHAEAEIQKEMDSE